ncbi:hypothetical protein [Kocuria kalidii]|uniref:hypothetical protein n=1 Tax=Kocuria kalidii TaxID=3376283 RepID=UPI0037915E27
MTTQDITFRTRTRTAPADPGPDGTLSGGGLPRRADEEAAVRAVVRLGDRRAPRERGH